MLLHRLLERRGRARWLAASVLALALPLAPALAQQRTVDDAPVKEDPASGKTLDLRKRGRGFSLFALGDVGIQGSRGTKDVGMAIINFGMCGADGNELTYPCPFRRRADGLLIASNFAYEFTATVSRSDFRKVRTLYPGVQDAVGGGWTGYYALSGSGFTGLYDWGPADRSTGRLFSGVGTTVGDNSCRDKSGLLNGAYDNSTGVVSVLAGSDCPETWGPNGFEGVRTFPDSAFIRAFNRDPANFAFDFWKLAPTEAKAGDYVGDFSTYFETSDHFAENAADFGAVTRLGTGRPKLRGFPIGLDLRVDVFVSSVPTLANAIFYQVQIINNSADVYGEPGVDFDSLYFGLIKASNTGSLRNGNHYYLPGQGLAIETGVSVNANCNNPRYQGGIYQACPAPTAAFRGLRWGAEGTIILKSPIGDLRNKKFTTSGDPFYDPTNVHAGDTITFNHGHRCGFIVCSSQTYDYSERSTHGYIASKEEDVLDGRVASDLTEEERWRVFHSPTAGNSGIPGGLPQFSRFVPPGGWDYDHDGVVDTLRVDTCHLNGCVRLWSDTLPGGQINRLRGSGTGQTTVAGPFRLKSRDTTAFVFAVVAASDSTSFNAILANATEYYMNFYAGPEAPPSPSITAVEVASAEARFAVGGAPFVRLAIGPEAETWVDPFLSNYATKVETDPAFSALRRLNPGLADSIRARAVNNLAEVLIFRSCDNGNSFDANGDCIGDPARNLEGAPVGPGWLPYGRLTPAAGTNDYPNSFTDNNVVAGRTYLYSVIARSRGATFAVRDSVGGREVTRILTITDTLAGTLALQGPSARRVYVPVTLPAGLSAASASVVSVTGPGIATAPVTIRLTDRPVAGTYHLEFANQFVITEVLDRTAGTYATTVVARDIVPSCVTSTGATATNCVVAESTYTTTERVPYSATSPTVSTTSSGNTTTTTTTINGLGFVALSGTKPLFVSTTLTPENTTPATLLGSPLDPGFIVRIDNAATGATAVALERLVKANGDTLNATIFSSATVQYLEASSVRNPLATGVYEYRFRGDAFGPYVPFRIDLLNPQRLADTVNASLRARPTATFGATSADVAALVGSSDLVAAAFPFQLVNATTGDTLLLAMERQSGHTLLLGSGVDTVRVAVPDSIWLPGDPFYALQRITRDSTAGGRVVLDASGKPITVTDTIVAFAPAYLGCSAPRASCNPVALTTTGGTGYRPLENGDKLVVGFTRPFTTASAVDITVAAPTAQPRFSTQDEKGVRVVPNPYIVQSQYDVVDQNRVGESRVLFTGMPPRGTLRIYSVSGQFLQRLVWTEADLNGTGDLPYNLRTREGTELATGLYIYVIEGTNEAGAKKTFRGRFVVIR